MMIRKLLYFSLLCFLISCNRDELIPAYISIENVDLCTDISQGANSHEISEISVSAAGQNLGIFPIPSEIPILEEGLTNITISAIIKQNGLADERVIYPHYDFLSLDLDLTPTSITEVEPIFKYRENVTILVQNFDTSISFNDGVTSEGFFDRTTDSDIAFGGTGGSAFSVLEEGGTNFYAETDEGYDLPVAKPVFLEIDYSGNQIFSIGAKATNGIEVTTTELVVVLPTQESDDLVWRKLYVNLTDFVFDNNSLGTEYEIFFGFIKVEEVESNPVIYLDNLKVIYPQ